MSQAPISELTRILAHDLRSPLTSILASLSFAQSSKDPIKRDLYLEACKHGAKRLFAMIDAIELTAHPQDTAPQNPVALEEIVREITHELETAYTFCDVSLTVELPTPSPMILGHAAFCRVLCRNLLLNALECSPPHAVVTVRLTADSEGVTLSVSDHGSSPPSESPDELFDPITQPKLRRAGLRTGRGLSLVATRIASEAQGARVTVQANPPGLTISVIWPGPPTVS